MPVHDWTPVVAGIFHHFHQHWVSTIASVLNDGLLPEGYYALAEQIAAGPQPDVIALESRDTKYESGTLNPAWGATLRLLEHPPNVRYVEELERETYARSADRVAIHHASGDRVVAFIELVSPGNKQSSYELSRFLGKLNEALDRGVHLLVVDVFPPGNHDPRGVHAAFWQLRSSEAHGVTRQQPLGISAYRSDLTPTAYFEPLAVADLLPDMPVFLTPDRYVNVPLEKTYMESWRYFPARWKSVIEPGHDNAGT